MSTSSTFHWPRILGTLLIVSLIAIGWLVRERSQLKTEIESLHHPRDSRLVLVDFANDITLTVTLEHETELWNKPEVPFEQQIRVGERTEVELPPGIYRAEWNDTKFPFLLLPKAELVLSGHPAPEGLVRIPAGPYLGEMSPVPQWALDPDGGRHGINGYLISKTEVSVAEYRDFLIELRKLRGHDDGQPDELVYGPRPFTEFCSDAEREDYAEGCPGHRPTASGHDFWRALDNDASNRIGIRFVSWYDALAYSQYRTARSAAKGEKLTFRLPTKTEWERAARGVDGRPYPWGFLPGATAQRVVQGGRLDVDSHPHLVSPYGLFHTASSVAEWCQTPEGRQRRYVMGRTWDLHTDRIHVGFGVGEEPTYRALSIGFRIVATESP